MKGLIEPFQNFKADSRDELATLLGVFKSETASHVAEAVENLKASTEAKSPFDGQDTVYKPHESVVSFAELERRGVQSYPETTQHLWQFLRRKPRLKSVLASLLTQLVLLHRQMASPPPLRQVYSETTSQERCRLTLATISLTLLA